jgi:hypothetical protein
MLWSSRPVTIFISFYMTQHYKNEAAKAHALKMVRIGIQIILLISISLLGLLAYKTFFK